VTYEHLAYDKGFWKVEGASAYVVVSGILTVTMKGQTVTRTGTLAYTFSNTTLTGRWSPRHGAAPRSEPAEGVVEWLAIAVGGALGVLARSAVYEILADRAGGSRGRRCS
jgi:hypothetical protein